MLFFPVSEGMTEAVQGQVMTSAYSFYRDLPPSLPLSLARSLFLPLSLSLNVLGLPSVWLKADIIGVLSSTNFKSSESSWLSLVGVLIPLFLARGHPERLKTQSMELIT